MQQRLRLVGTIVLIILVTALVGWYASRSDASDPIGDDGINPTDVAGTICELGTIYRRTATHQSGCSCPEGYAFAVDVVAYENCPDGTSECPILEVTCQQK